MRKNNSYRYVIMALIGIGVLVFCSSFSGYYAREPNIQSIVTYLTNLDSAILQVTWNEYTLKFMMMGGLVYGIGCLYYISTRRNYRFGEEFGSAKFVSPKEICGMYADKDYGKNRLISENVRLSYDGYKTQINNHMLVIGGSGSGKTRSIVKPNAMQMYGSMVIVDPDGGTLRSTGNMFIKHGYKLKVLNLVDMFNSDFYNPFKYLQNEADILRLTTNLIKNTTPQDTQKGDPFWEDSTKMFLQAIMLYIFYEAPPEERNWNTMMEMIKYATLKYDEKGRRLKSALDRLFDILKIRNPDHPAIMPYEKTMGGADDTVRSILQSVDSRLAYCNVDGIRNIFYGDTIDLENIAKERTALFCIIPEDDDSFNFVMGMFYTQMYQVLFRMAKKSKTGRLPVDVTVWMDEFANVALPDNFRRILATARKYGINIAILIQSLAQLKPMFKNNAWEEIPDNCDTHVYLGGNSESTFKNISGRIGKETIDKKSFSVSRGARGNSSTSEDKTGRELMAPDEVGKIKINECLLFVRGCAPVMDHKYDIKQHPNYRLIADGGKNKAYEHMVAKVRSIGEIDIDIDNFEML